MSKILMIIGAGQYQMPAIIKAKEMGLRVLATDLNPTAPGFELADFNRVVDIKDAEANLKVAREFAVDGVMSIVSELSVRTVSYVAKQMGLPGLDYEAAIASTDKAIMRTKFLEAGLPEPGFFKVSTREEAADAISELGLPVVMKPTGNAGSRGVTKIEKPADIDFSFAIARENSHSGELIVEQFVEGIEMTIESLSYDGKHQILAMSSKKRIPFPYCVSIDLTYPPPFSQEALDGVGELVMAALDAVGINMGATHSEVMMTEQCPVMLEMAARGGGFGVFSDVTPLVSGVDIVRECINMAAGYVVDITPKFSRAAVLRFFNLPQGRLERISGLEEARSIEGVYKVELEVAPGDTIRPIISDGTRHGLIITSGDTRGIAVQRANRAESTVKFEIVT